VRALVEEHGRGRQLVRARVWPRPSRPALAATAALAVFVGGGALILAPVLAAVAAWTLVDCAAAMGALLGAVAEEQS
jgi:hypothetical protein